LVALGIVSVMAMVTVPFLTDYIANRELKNASREIVGDFYRMKERAVSETRVYQISLDSSANSYTVERCAQSGQYCLSNEFEVVETRGLSAFKGNVKLESAKFGAGHTIRFQTRGTASPGSVRLTNRLGSAASVIVNITGRTRIAWDMK
jgi:Tfp pilus assembly protein FimT